MKVFLGGIEKYIFGFDREYCCGREYNFKPKDTGVELFLQWNGTIEKAIDSGIFCRDAPNQQRLEAQRVLTCALEFPIFSR